MPELAFEIESGQELALYEPNRVKVGSSTYFVFTGFEGTGQCWWCGADLNGKQRKWCTRSTHSEKRGHWYTYYRHFCWPYAREWCIEKQEGNCANCGKHYGYNLEVHHIIPLNGKERQWTAFNLPWNLIGFCHECHQEIHTVMRPPKLKSEPPDSWEEALKVGQGIMVLSI